MYMCRLDVVVCSVRVRNVFEALGVVCSLSDDAKYKQVCTFA